MFKILTVIGARPQFIKAAAISRAIKTSFSEIVTEIIVHTGQHYDHEMSAVFFSQLNIPNENYQLNAGSGNHGAQTACMITGIEEILMEEKPNCIILYGDTNSTLAGAVAASKLLIPIVHIEAGMRSFTKQVPEEINRIICDHVSTLLFTPTLTGAANLYNEGFSKNNVAPFHVDNPKVIPCGDIMYDNCLYFKDVALRDSKILDSLNLKSQNYTLLTIHRNNNTDDPNRLFNIFKSLDALVHAAGAEFVIPLHPRTQKMLSTVPGLQDRLAEVDKIKIIPPASYLDMIALEANCDMVITDSGGVQKEAYYFEKPCIILQSETPWVELVQNGCAELADADCNAIESAYYYFKKPETKLDFKPVFGDGKAAEFTVGKILEYLSPL